MNGTASLLIQRSYKAELFAIFAYKLIIFEHAIQQKIKLVITQKFFNLIRPIYKISVTLVRKLNFNTYIFFIATWTRLAPPPPRLGAPNSEKENKLENFKLIYEQQPKFFTFFI